MRVVTLIALNKHAKQIVKQHGERWEVVRSAPYVLFIAERGPWLLVKPLTEERAPASGIRAAKIVTPLRWVHEFSDENFKVAP